MSWFPQPSSPREALRDLAAFMRQRCREPLIGDANIGTAPPPQIVEVELYPSNRTDAEIVADQKKDQAKKDAAQKEKQRQFQKLEKQLGID